MNLRAARCVHETAVRNGKARGHKLPPSLREIDKFYELEGDVMAVTSPINLGRPWWSAGHGRPGLVSPSNIRATAGRPATAGRESRVMAML